MKMGSTFKGKNLLLWEQILFYKNWPLKRKDEKMSLEELLSPGDVSVHHITTVLWKPLLLALKYKH